MDKLLLNAPEIKLPLGLVVTLDRGGSRNRMLNGILVVTCTIFYSRRGMPILGRPQVFLIQMFRERSLGGRSRLRHTNYFHV